MARTTASLRVLETSHPPGYYLPADAFASGMLRLTGGHTFCEWKGQASYVDLVTPTATAARAGWFYPAPVLGFECLVGLYAVMPTLVDSCTVDGERVVAQAGAACVGSAVRRSCPFGVVATTPNVRDTRSSGYSDLPSSSIGRSSSA